MLKLVSSWTRDSRVQWAGALVAFVALLQAIPPAPEREVIIRYVDEDGNAVSKEQADAHFAELARLEAIEREALVKYAAEKAAKEAASPASYSWAPSDATVSPDDRDQGLPAIGARSERVHVNGYFRRDGRYVPSHYRSARNSTERDNWGSRGNTNPVTGRQGTRKSRK